jgi:hypothetical protein
MNTCHVTCVGNQSNPKKKRDGTVCSYVSIGCLRNFLRTHNMALTFLHPNHKHNVLAIHCVAPNHPSLHSPPPLA